MNARKVHSITSYLNLVIQYFIEKTRQRADLLALLHACLAIDK